MNPLRSLCLLLLICLPGCALRPLKGGHAVTSHVPGGGVAQSRAQSDNPSQASRQSQETVKVRTYTVPAGTQFAPSASASIPISSHSAHLSHSPGSSDLRPLTSDLSFHLSAPMPVTEREETRAATELGAAQKDTAREIGAKLASLKGIVWVGVLLFIFGIASLAYPPLRAIIGSITTSVAIILGGLALMVLPTLIVGNELLILGGVALIVGAWFFAHRHGQLRGQLTAVASSAAKKRAAK